MTRAFAGGLGGSAVAECRCRGTVWFLFKKAPCLTMIKTIIKSSQNIPGEKMVKSRLKYCYYGFYQWVPKYKGWMIVYHYTVTCAGAIAYLHVQNFLANENKSTDAARDDRTGLPAPDSKEPETCSCCQGSDRRIPRRLRGCRPGSGDIQRRLPDCRGGCYLCWGGGVFRSYAPRERCELAKNSIRPPSSTVTLAVKSSYPFLRMSTFSIPVFSE